MSSERDLPRHDSEPASVVPADGDTVTDAHLVRYLDGELSQPTGASLRAILTQRADLAARLAQLERRSTRLAELLAAVSPDTPQSRDSAAAMRPHVLRTATQRSWWLQLPARMKAAAAIALLLGLVLAVPDARAWVLDRLRDVGATLGVGAREPVQEPPAVGPADPVPAAIAITFTVTRDTLEVGASRLGGILLVRRGSSATASAEAAGVDAQFTVVPGGLQIAGPASAGAVYTITVPSHVRALRLERAAGDVTVHALSTVASDVRIELRR